MRDSRSIVYDKITGPGAAAKVLERNIEALLDGEEQLDRERSVQERVAASITRFTGSTVLVYLHLAVIGFWVLVNAARRSWNRSTPPSCFWRRLHRSRRSSSIRSYSFTQKPNAS